MDSHDRVIIAAVPVAVAVGVAEDCFLDTMIYLQPIISIYIERVEGLVLFGVLPFVICNGVRPRLLKLSGSNE